MNASLLRSTACSKFFYPSEIAIKATELQQEAQELELFTVCAFKVLLESHSDPYLYEKSYEEAKWDPILVLHSSGSTGELVIYLSKWIAMTKIQDDPNQS